MVWWRVAGLQARLARGLRVVIIRVIGGYGLDLSDVRRAWGRSRVRVGVRVHILVLVGGWWIRLIIILGI